MKFRLEDFPKRETAMICDTPEEAREFEKILHNAGRRWSSGLTYEKMHHETMGLHGGCVFFFNSGNYSDTLEVTRDYANPVLRWSDFSDDDLAENANECSLSFNDMIRLWSAV